MANLKKSLERFNLVEIPAIDQDGTILAGAQRIKALQILGRGGEMISVRVPNRKLTDEEKFQQSMLGIKTKVEVADLDIRNYAKYLLQEGADVEKRELLGCLKGNILLSEKKILLTK